MQEQWLNQIRAVLLNYDVHTSIVQCYSALKENRATNLALFNLQVVLERYLPAHQDAIKNAIMSNLIEFTRTHNNLNGRITGRFMNFLEEKSASDSHQQAYATAEPITNDDIIERMILNNSDLADAAFAYYQSWSSQDTKTLVDTSLALKKTLLAELTQANSQLLTPKDLKVISDDFGNTLKQHIQGISERNSTLNKASFLALFEPDEPPLDIENSFMNKVYGIIQNNIIAHRIVDLALSYVRPTSYNTKASYERDVSAYCKDNAITNVDDMMRFGDKIAQKIAENCRITKIINPMALRANLKDVAFDILLGEAHPDNIPPRRILQ